MVFARSELLLLAMVIAGAVMLAGCDREKSSPPDTNDPSAEILEKQAPSVADRSDPRYIKCWVHVANSNPTPKFKNPFDQIRGPIELANLRELDGTRHRDWNNKIDVLGTGATARVTVWSDENFAGKTWTLGPNEKLADVAALELDDGISSLKIEFVPN